MVSHSISCCSHPFLHVCLFMLRHVLGYLMESGVFVRCLFVFIFQFRLFSQCGRKHASAYANSSSDRFLSFQTLSPAPTHSVTASNHPPLVSHSSSSFHLCAPRPSLLLHCLLYSHLYQLFRSFCSAFWALIITQECCLNRYICHTHSETQEPSRTTQSHSQSQVAMNSKLWIGPNKTIQVGNHLSGVPACFSM